MNRNANGMIMGLVLVIVIIAIVGFVGARLMKTTPTATIQPTVSQNKGDIDRSGAADEEDKRLVRASLDCLKSQPCWNTTIGKTKDGDNPLYVFDLDLDGDGTITQADIDLVK